ncbi:MAG: amidohydrolase [Bacteroidales bacterium]
MKRIKVWVLTIAATLLICGEITAQKATLNDLIKKAAEDGLKRYQDTYIDLHRNPELSLLETRTSGKLAEELRTLGFEVSTNIGGTGVVGIFRNGSGKVLMLRTDMDALPVKENTGLPFSSSVVMKDMNGKENPVMHACGHDLHMTMWLGTLRTLVTLKSEWKGTLMAVAQPGEEGWMGAQKMIDDGLFRKFPVPDAALCYHVSAELPTGQVGYYPGPIFAGSNTAEIVVKGIGGHGALPHNTIDPIVLSSKIILDIQTIVSRRINPVKPAVVTVGSIHGGTKANVIPDEVRMLVTIRFFEESVYEKIKESLKQIVRYDALAAGLPEDKLPVITFDSPVYQPVANNPELVMKVAGSMKNMLGETNVTEVDPSTVAEDFGMYGRTEEKIPIALFWLGGVNTEKYELHMATGAFLPALHNSQFAPDFIPAFKTGVTAMSRTLIDLFLSKK